MAPGRGKSRGLSWRAQRQILAIAAYAFLSTQAVTAEDTCQGPVVKLGVSNGTSPVKTLYGVLAGFGGIPSLQESSPLQLAVADPIQACQDIKPVAGALVLVERGNCSFVRKYETVVAAGAKGMLLFNSAPGCISMGGNASNITNSSAPVDQVPAAISLDRTTGQQLMEWLKDTSLTATLQRVDMSPLDASAAVLWVLAVGTLVSGSLWAGWDHALERKAAMAAAGGGGGRGGEGGAPPSEVLDITTTGAVAFVCVASAMLLLLFFFMSQAFFYFILVMFCLAGAQALTVVLLLPVQLYRPQLMARGWEVRWLGWVPAGVLLVAPVAVAVAVVFGVYRNSGWSWVLQDLLGVALMVTILRTLRLGSMKVACVLLPLCFFYDVFWVFLQPLIWHTDSSVMVTVAEGAGVNEFLPMLLRVPRFSAPPIVREYSLLGFGDVILPGLLAALTRRIDIDNSKQWVRGYFAPCVAGYGGGLLLTYAALMFSWFGDQGQPALLYLTPCTLGVVLLLGALRKELPLLFAASSTAGWEVMEDEALDEDAWQEAEAGHATHGGSRGAESRHAQRAPHQDTAGSSREEGKSLLGSQGPRSSRYDDSV